MKDCALPFHSAGCVESNENVSGKGAHRRAFALIDLLFLVVFVAALAGVFSSVPERLRERTHITIDLNNLRQILHASALYSNENNDHLAHPTWGGDLSGPDGWAYLTSKNGREVPGAIYNFPGSCANRDINTAQFTNQLAYFKVGQVSQYCPGLKRRGVPRMFRHGGQEAVSIPFEDFGSRAPSRSLPIRGTNDCWCRG